MLKIVPDIIIFSPAGRLGNRLQTGAYSLAYAAETDRVLWLLCMDGYEDLFIGSSRNPSCRFPARHRRFFYALLLRKLIRYLVWKMMTLCERYSILQRLLKVSIVTSSKDSPVIFDHLEQADKRTSNRVTIVRGYYIYCDPAMLQRQKAVVTGYLHPTGDTWQDCLKRISSKKNHYDAVIGVHMRQGDYATYCSGVHYFTFDEYLNYMKDLCRNESRLNLHFILCSDADLSQFVSDDISWEPGPGDVIGDMYTLAACDYVMGPFSTFNRWSAFFGGSQRLELSRGMRDITLNRFSPVLDLTYMSLVPKP